MAVEAKSERFIVAAEKEEREEYRVYGRQLIQNALKEPMKISAYSTSRWCRFAYLSFHCSLENHFSKSDLYFDPQLAYSVIITLINIFDIEPNKLDFDSETYFPNILFLNKWHHYQANTWRLSLPSLFSSCLFKSSSYWCTAKMQPQVIHFSYIHPVYLTHFTGTY